MRIKYNQAARKAKHEDWMRAHPEFAAALAVLDEDDEEAENTEDIDIDRD